MNRSLLVIIPLCLLLCANRCSQQIQTTACYPETEVVVGDWFTPHAAFIRILLKENGSFEFFDYDTVSGHEVCLKGMYGKSNDTVVLSFQDSSQMVLSLLCDEMGNYYLINESHYFVKSDQENMHHKDNNAH